MTRYAPVQRIDTNPGLALDTKRFDRLNPRDGFDEKRLVFRPAIEFLVQACADDRRDDDGEDGIER